MRSRSIRLSIGILLVLGLAIVALGFTSINIDLPGFPALARGGSGPLGLKLGLDLRGGGHLVYQADTGTRFDVAYTQPIDFNELAATLEQLRFGEDELALEDYQIVPRDLTLTQVRQPVEEAPESEGEAVPDEPAPDGQAEDQPAPDEQAEDVAPPEPTLVHVVSRFQIRATLLDAADPRRNGLREALSTALGEISLFQITDIPSPTQDQMEGVLDNITRRVNRFGTEEPIIQIFGEDRIIVQLPGASGSTSEIQFIEPAAGPAQLGLVRGILGDAGFEDATVTRLDDNTFHVISSTIGADIRADAQAALTDQIGDIQSFEVNSAIDAAKNLIGQTARLEFKERTCADEGCVRFADADLGLSGDDLDRAEAGADPSGIGWVVNLQFKDRGTEIFSELTRRIVDVPTKRIAVIMDDDQLIAPVALAWIRNGRTVISGDFTRDEARNLAIQLESGRLPVPLQLVQERDVDALLSSESLRNSLLAGMVGLGLVLVFMIAYYRMAGVVAAGALIFYAVIVLAVFKLIPITLELAHVGGFILSIGMAVDANILIFERMKEEVRIGRTLSSSMEVGFSRAWPAIRDSNISTMITCLVLMWFGDRLGGGLVTGVAISLFIGVAVSMFTALVVSRNLLQLMAWIGLGQRISLFTPESASSPAQTTGGNR